MHVAHYDSIHDTYNNLLQAVLDPDLQRIANQYVQVSIELYARTIYIVWLLIQLLASVGGALIYQGTATAAKHIKDIAPQLRFSSWHPRPIPIAYFQPPLKLTTYLRWLEKPTLPAWSRQGRHL